MERKLDDIMIALSGLTKHGGQNSNIMMSRGTYFTGV